VDLPLFPMLVKKDQGIHCLVLGREGHPEVYGKMIEEGFDLLFAVPKTRLAQHLMKVHIALYPRTVALLGTYRIVATPHHLVHFIEKSACHGALHFCKAPPVGRQNIGYWQQAILPILFPNSPISGKFA
jgi:hypothetical protein